MEVWLLSVQKGRATIGIKASLVEWSRRDGRNDFNASGRRLPQSEVEPSAVTRWRVRALQNGGYLCGYANGGYIYGSEAIGITEAVLPDIRSNDP